jgi:FAD:protein FMN transferase
MRRHTSSVAVAREAMATRFEIVLEGNNPVSLKAAGEAALDEIERLENQLSLYRPTSQISLINRRAAFEPVRLEPNLFRLLQHAQRLSAETAGAFDITVAPLVRCWGFMGGSGALPSPEAIDLAHAKVGMQWIELREEDFTIRFLKEGMMLDLGAIGKGFAIDQAVEVLRECGVNTAFIHGGTSTAYGLGRPAAGSWKIAIPPPISANAPMDPILSAADAGEANRSEVLTVVELIDEALSVSAPHGKAFSVEGKLFGHVLDPRCGRPVDGAALAAVVVPSATESDALSTALLVLGDTEQETMAGLRPGIRTLVAMPRANGSCFSITARGLTVAEEFAG